MKIKKLECTKDSMPFNAAINQLVPIDLAHYGYVEEEYLFSDVANVYTLKEDGAHIKFENAPYTNRFIIRKPSDVTKCSGRIVFEILNSTNGWDVCPMWALVWKKILRDGDIYVGLSARSTCGRYLKKFDDQRYSEISWKNPNPNPGPISHDIVMWQQSVPEEEDGLVWDMITSLTNYLKSNEGMQVTGKKVDRIYAVGTSQSAMMLITYMNVFHESTRHTFGTPCIDGYLTYSGGRMVSLNQEESPIGVEADIQKTRNVAVPVIRVLSQWEFKYEAGHISLRREDSDEMNDRFRLYEMAGHPHNTFMGAFYRPGFDEIAKIEKTTFFPTWPMMHLPMEMFMEQALRNLDAWVTYNVVPPRADRIEVDSTNNEVLDEHGNCKGGFRFPQLDVPTGTYQLGNGKNPQESLFIPFSQEKLKELYPTFKDYVYKIFARIDDLCAKNFISSEHADQMKFDVLKADLYRWM